MVLLYIVIIYLLFYFQLFLKKINIIDTFKYGIIKLIKNNNFSLRKVGCQQLFKRRCIALDLHGTLLKEEQTVDKHGKPTVKRVITPRSAKAIIQLQKAGHVIVPVTSRHRQNVQELIKGVNEQLDSEVLQCPIIGSGGAAIHTQDGECISQLTIDRENLNKLLQIMNAQDISYFLDDFDGKSLYRQSKSENLRRGENRKRQYFDGLIEEVDQEILQVMAYPGNPEKQKKLLAAIMEAELPLSAVTSNNRNMEIQHIDAEKGKAMAFFANHCGIPLEDCIAFGDSMNDQSIFTIVGRSYAMPHAPQELLEINGVTKIENSNNEDGVAIQLEELAKQWDHQQTLKIAKHRDAPTFGSWIGKQRNRDEQQQLP